MNHIDAATQMQMQLPNYLQSGLMSPNVYNNNTYSQQQQLGGYASGNVSFDDPTFDNSFLNNNNNRLFMQQQQQQQLQQQGQSYIYNNNNNNNNNSVDMYQNQNNNNILINQNSSSFDDPQINSNFQRNNPKRNTLKRSQRVMDNSNEDFHSPNYHPNNNLNRAQSNVVDNNSTKNDKNENFLRAPSVPRRKSLPSIVKNQSFKENEIAHSSSDLNDKNEETFIIENGIRKRITEKSNPSILQTNNITSAQSYKNHQNTGQINSINNNNNKSNRLSDYSDDTSPKLPRKIIIESITSLNTTESKLGPKRVSMPSINALLSPKFANKGSIS